MTGFSDKSGIQVSQSAFNILSQEVFRKLIDKFIPSIIINIFFAVIRSTNIDQNCVI